MSADALAKLKGQYGMGGKAKAEVEPEAEVEDEDEEVEDDLDLDDLDLDDFDDDEELEEEEEDEEEGEELEPAKDSTTESILAQLQELNTKLTPKEEAPEEEPEPALSVWKPQEFFKSTEEISEIVSSSKKFNEFLNNFAQAIREDTLKETVELSSKVVTKSVQREQLLGRFWKENSDLDTEEGRLEVQGQVRALFQMHPDWETSKLLKAASERSRKILDIKQEAEEAETKARSKKRASVPKGAGGNRLGDSGKKKAKPNRQQQLMTKMFQTTT